MKFPYFTTEVLKRHRQVIFGIPVRASNRYNNTNYYFTAILLKIRQM